MVYGGVNLALDDEVGKAGGFDDGVAGCFGAGVDL